MPHNNVIRIILNEIKKIYNSKNVLTAVLVFLITGLVFPGVLTDNTALTNKVHTNQYPEQIPLDFKNYSVELMFQDMILETYGETIDKSELPALKKQFNDFSTDIIEAVEKDETLQRVGLKMNTDFEFCSIFTPENAPDFSEADQQYQWECTNGTRKLNGTKYPLYFAKAFLSLIDTIESNNGNFPFYTMSATLISGISNNLLIILMAILSTFIMIIPYAENEMRSGVIAFDYSSKTGRKMYVYKLASVFISVSIFIGASVLIAVFMFRDWEIQRYYHCIIDSVMFQEKGITYPEFIQKCYSGISLLGLYGGLILFLFVCGVLLSVLVFIISNKFNNIISAIMACLPLFAMPVLVFYRYVTYALDTSGGVLLFRGEPILAMVILCTILLFIVTTVYKKQTKADI